MDINSYKNNYQKQVFIKALGGMSMGRTLEITIEKRMQNMVYFENKNIIFVVDLHFDIFDIFSFGGSQP